MPIKKNLLVILLFSAQLLAITPVSHSEEARLVKLYKNLHQHPELAFMEEKTAQMITGEFRKLGMSVQTGIGKTGVVGIFRNGKGPTVMYRADMDANAIQEQTNLPFASKVMTKNAEGLTVPAAHMCGHDAHVVWMLGMAKKMVENKDKWSGTLVLVAQPAEETGQGAQAMIADGFYEKYHVPKPDYFLGMHTAPFPVGMVVNNSGPVMAGVASLDVTFHGFGGHGSMPHLTKDPIVMSAMAITQYQTLISRNLDPQKMGVLTVGAVHAGTDNNVIPEQAALKLNLRYFDAETKSQLIGGINRINEGVAASFGAQTPTLVLKSQSEPVINNDSLSRRLETPLKALLGDKNVVQTAPSTGSEDIYALLGGYTEVPFLFLFVGVADPLVFQQALAAGKEVPYSPHNSNYIVDLRAIPLGVEVATTVVFDLLKK